MSTARNSSIQPTSLSEATQPSTAEAEKAEALEQVTWDVFKALRQFRFTLICTSSKGSGAHGFNLFGTREDPNKDEGVIVAIGEAQTLDDWKALLTGCTQVEKSMEKFKWSKLLNAQAVVIPADLIPNISLDWICPPDADSGDHDHVGLWSSFKTQASLRSQCFEGNGSAETFRTICLSPEFLALRSYIGKLVDREQQLKDMSQEEYQNAGYDDTRDIAFPVAVNVDPITNLHMELLERLTLGSFSGALEGLRSLTQVPMKIPMPFDPLTHTGSSTSRARSGSHSYAPPVQPPSPSTLPAFWATSG